MRAEAVEAEVEMVEVETEEGRLIDGVRATCTKCGYEAECGGTSDASVTRCMVMLREGCPLGESNYYEGEL